MLCCGQERATPFCPECGKQHLLTLPLTILVKDLEAAAESGKGTYGLPERGLVQLVFWADALAKLIASSYFYREAWTDAERRCAIGEAIVRCHVGEKGAIEPRVDAEMVVADKIREWEAEMIAKNRQGE